MFFPIVVTHHLPDSSRHLQMLKHRFELKSSNAVLRCRSTVDSGYQAHALVGTISTAYALCATNWGLKVDNTYLFHDVITAVVEVHLRGKVTVASYKKGKLCCC